MEEKPLYPIKFCTLRDEWSWGAEEYRLADLGWRDSLVKEGWLAGNSISELMDTYIDKVVGEDVYDYYGRQFPICVKYIELDGDLPLVVHPDDTTAEERYDFLGKDKLWLVLECSPGSIIYSGFKKDSDASELFAACEEGTQDSLLCGIAPYKGMSLLIPSGTPHCASGKLKLLEISESSPMDFCLSGRGQTVCTDEFDPALSLTEALDIIDYKASNPAVTKGNVLADIPQFNIQRLELRQSLKCNKSDFDSFILFVCESGRAQISLEQDGMKFDWSLERGELLLIPAECGDFVAQGLVKDSSLLEITNLRKEKDSYINPSVAARLPEDE